MRPTGCFRCGAAATYPLFPLRLAACEECARAWRNDEQCSFEAVNAALGFSGDPLAYTKAKGAQFDAELLKRTEAWARAWRAAA